MPLNVDATWANAPDSSSDPVFDAIDLRMADAALVAGAGDAALVRGGIALHSLTSLQVTVNGSDQVTVQPGSAVIPCDAIAVGGAYRVGITSAFTEALTARNATNPRIDLVVLRMLDTDVVGAHTQRRARLEVIAGVPAASPSAPAKPSMAIELARINVPQTGGGAATVNNDKRQFSTANGGDLLVPSWQELPATAAPWQRARTLDTGGLFEWDGAAWRTVDSTPVAPVTAFLPAGDFAPRASHVLTKEGFWVQVTDGSGFVTIPFLPAFPHGILSVNFTLEWSSGAVSAQVIQSASTLAQIVALIRNAGGAPMPGVSVGVNYSVRGW